MALQKLVMKDALTTLKKKSKDIRNKHQLLTYKLLSNIEASIALKGVLKEHIFNAKVEFTLKKILKISKKEFYDVIIESIKQKRKLMEEVGLNHGIDAHVCKDRQ